MQLNKIKRFMADVDTQIAVKQFVTDQFLKSNKSTDVNYLAAKMIAIELLNNAWKEMDKQRERRDIPVSGSSQVGL